MSKRSERRPRVRGSRIRDQWRSRGPRSAVVRLRGAAADRGHGHVADDRSASVARGVRMRRVGRAVVCGARRVGRSGRKTAVSVAEARLAWLDAAGTRRRSAPSRVTRHDPGCARRTRGDRRVWSRAKRLARLREPRACKPTAVHVTWHEEVVERLPGGFRLSPRDHELPARASRHRTTLCHERRVARLARDGLQRARR